MSGNQTVVKAVAAAAAAALVVVGIFFLLFKKFARRCEKNKIEPSFCREETGVNREGSGQFGISVKGFIVDENGQDVLYMRRLEDGENNIFQVMFNPSYEEDHEDEKRVDVISDRPTKSECTEAQWPHDSCTVISAEREKKINSQNPAAPPLASETLPSTIPAKNVLPLQMPMLPPPPPPPPPPPLPPPLPPIKVKKNAAPRLRPNTSGLFSSLKPPPAPRGAAKNKSKGATSTAENLEGTGVGQMKLKPLHWDKVITTAEHSMVWNDINDGSLRFDDHMIEALFGFTNNNHKWRDNNPTSRSSAHILAPRRQVFILEPRKSQNTAIVLRSLAVSRKEIIDALLKGQGLSVDTLEKLTRIAPTPDEEAKILQFNGNPTELADAESFLFHILKAVSSAFIRIKAMLFRSNYDSEVLQLKKSLQTLELGCKELRTRGLFLKLLEAILKAGNKMNAGTSRGNAQGFNLSTLQKLSDVKSIDGKTTLLHFVVEQVVRSEGRRCVINRYRSLDRNTSKKSNYIDVNSTNLTDEEKQREYLMLGLPAIAGLNIEFSNLKKAATIEYNSFINMCSSLSTRVSEVQQLVSCCSKIELAGFAKEMKAFLEKCKEELKVLREEQIRIMDLAKRTTEYYQSGAPNDTGANPLQIFVIVKDFLDMVDRVRGDITQKLGRRNDKTGMASPCLLLQQTKASVNFPNLHSNLSRPTSSSESEDEF